MNKAAIIHQMNVLDAYKLDDQNAVIKVKTEKDDLYEVILHYADKYLLIYGIDSLNSIKMTRVAHDGIYDYYEAVVPVDLIVLKYFFEIIDHQGQKAYLGATHFYNQIPNHFTMMYDYPRRAREEDDYSVPTWVDDAIVYQIFPERYYKGDGQDHGKAWYGPVDYKTELGGTLKGIKDKLDYIQDLGVNVIYMTPVFESPSNHKYNTTDYYNIDKNFGSKEDFRALIEAAHARDMKIIIDGVFNHCGDTFEPFQDVKKKGQQSDYADWFEIKEFPIHMGGKRKAPNYDAFAYHGKMPKLKTKNPAVKEYLLEVVRYWTSEFDIDGWRLDVADEVSHDFWRRFRKLVKDINPEALIIGEVWYDSSEWLRGDEFDTVMNYKFEMPVVNWLAKDLIDVETFSNMINQVRGIYPRNAYQCMWNLIGSHDTARFLYEARGNKSKLKLAVLMQMTFTGIPFIYYGDELGMTGGTDPDCRRGMIWDSPERDDDLLNYYKHLIAIRKDHVSLQKGELQEVLVDRERKLYGYEKIQGHEIVTILINNSDDDAHVITGKGEIDLITGTMFDGVLKANSGLILK